MIPKKIHYCWFGKSKLSNFNLKCIESWKKYCPDYEIIKWDESNFNIEENDYAKEAYNAKKWAFVSDYARLKIIYDNGGIYLDTDVELIKPLDDLLNDKCFFGTEMPGFVSTGMGFGAEKGNEFVEMMLNKYKNIHFCLKGGGFDLTPCPRRNTAPLLTRGYIFHNEEIWVKDGCKVYPPKYFSPIDYETKKIHITDKTYSIHNYTGTWITEEEKKVAREIDNVKNTNNKISAFFKCHYIKYRYEKNSGYCTNIVDYFCKKIRKKYLLRKV